MKVILKITWYRGKPFELNIDSMHVVIWLGQYCKCCDLYGSRRWCSFMVDQ